MDIEELVAAAKAGDEDAFCRLMVLEKERLYRIAYAYLKHEEDAVEAIQETTYRAWLKFGKLREARLFRTWIVRILLNCCHDEWKRRKRRASLEARSGAEAGASAAFRPGAATAQPESPEEGWALRLEVSEAVERLEPKYRQLIVLKYFEDMTLTEIADTLEKPLGTVKTWLHQALRRLQPLMADEEGDGR